MVVSVFKSNPIMGLSAGSISVAIIDQKQNVAPVPNNSLILGRNFLCPYMGNGQKHPKYINIINRCFALHECILKENYSRIYFTPFYTALRVSDGKHNICICFWNHFDLLNTIPSVSLPKSCNSFSKLLNSHFFHGFGRSFLQSEYLTKLVFGNQHKACILNLAWI